MAALVVYIGIRAALTNEVYERKALSQMNYSSSTLVAKSGEIYDTNMTVSYTHLDVYKRQVLTNRKNHHWSV